MDQAPGNDLPPPLPIVAPGIDLSTPPMIVPDLYLPTPPMVAPGKNILTY